MRWGLKNLGTTSYLRMRREASKRLGGQTSSSSGSLWSRSATSRTFQNSLQKPPYPGSRPSRDGVPGYRCSSQRDVATTTFDSSPAVCRTQAD